MNPTSRPGKESTEVDRLDHWLGRIYVQRTTPVAANQEKSVSPLRDSDHVPEVRTGNSLRLKKSSVASTSSYSGSQGSSEGYSSPSYDSDDDDDDASEQDSEEDNGAFLSARPSQEQRAISPHSTQAAAASRVHMDSSTLRSEHKEEQQSAVPCFICQTSNMSSSMNDPQGRPLCIVCGNLYYRHRGSYINDTARRRPRRATRTI